MIFFLTAVGVSVLLKFDAFGAQSLSSTIVECADVKYLNSTDTISAQFTVVNKTFTTVGLARIPITASALSGLFWTEGVAVTDSNDQRIFDKNFYFRDPPAVNLTGTGACAVFSGKVVFNSTSLEDAQGTCQQAMSTDCVNAMIKLATNFDLTGLNTNDACSKLQTAFSDTLYPSCASNAGASGWTGLSSRRLAGDNSAVPISSNQNASSNRWPIVPRDYNLALASSIETTDDRLSQTIEASFYKITTILTLFYPGNDSLISQAEAQITCVGTLGPSLAANGTKSSSDLGSVGVFLKAQSAAALITILALVSFFVL